MALPPNQGGQWGQQIPQGQVRPPGYGAAPVQQPGMQNLQGRPMVAQQQFGAPPTGMPKQMPPQQGVPQPLNRQPPANAGSISFNVSGAQPKGPTHPQMMAGQPGQQMQRIVPQGQMPPGAQLAAKPMNAAVMNPGMNVAGRGMGGVVAGPGMPGSVGAASAAGGGSGAVPTSGQPGAGGDVGVPKVMQGDGRILSKQKLQELVSYIDSDERLDNDAEDLLMLIADEFVESVTSFACRIAKHRKSPKLEVKDLQFHLDQNWGIKVPGFGAEDEKGPVRLPMNDAHRQRLQAVKRNRQK